MRFRLHVRGLGTHDFPALSHRDEVYCSDFGPLDHPPIRLWWDMVVMGVFSLVIYYWALAVALPTDKIELMINEVVIPEEPDSDLPPMPSH